MTTVSARLKDTISNAREQIEVFEKSFEKKVGRLEKKAKASLDEVPLQLKGAWEHVVTRLRGAMDFASREDLRALGERVDELARKVEKLIRASAKPAPKKKA